MQPLATSQDYGHIPISPLPNPLQAVSHKEENGQAEVTKGQLTDNGSIQYAHNAEYQPKQGEYQVDEPTGDGRDRMFHGITIQRLRTQTKAENNGIK